MPDIPSQVILVLCIISISESRQLHLQIHTTNPRALQIQTAGERDLPDITLDEMDLNLIK